MLKGEFKMYEVTYMEYENNKDTGFTDSVFTSEQFEGLATALDFYNKKKETSDVEHVRLAVILEEYTK